MCTLWCPLINTQAHKWHHASASVCKTHTSSYFSQWAVGHTPEIARRTQALTDHAAQTCPRPLHWCYTPANIHTRSSRCSDQGAPEGTCQHANMHRSCQTAGSMLMQATCCSVQCAGPHMHCAGLDVCPRASLPHPIQRAVIVSLAELHKGVDHHVTHSLEQAICITYITVVKHSHLLSCHKPLSLSLCRHVSGLAVDRSIERNACISLETVELVIQRRIVAAHCGDDL